MRKILISIFGSRVGWLLVIANAIIFLCLIKEIQQNEANRPICKNGEVVTMGLMGPSNLFLIHIFTNFPALLIEAKISELVFHNYQDPCIYYDFQSYPVVYIGKLTMVVVFQFFQWILIGYLLEKIMEISGYKIRKSENKDFSVR